MPVFLSPADLAAMWTKAKGEDKPVPEALTLMDVSARKIVHLTYLPASPCIHVSACHVSLADPHARRPDANRREPVGATGIPTNQRSHPATRCEASPRGQIMLNHASC